MASRDPHALEAPPVSTGIATGAGSHWRSLAFSVEQAETAVHKGKLPLMTFEIGRSEMK